MRRLCMESSRSYTPQGGTEKSPGRSVRYASGVRWCTLKWNSPHSLNSVTVGQVLELENLYKAWKQVKANKGVPGVDGISVEEFPEYAYKHWEGIKTALLEGTYTPSPVKRVEIPKDSGGTRPLGIPTVLDRVIQ
ncbi:MAG: hypothetical protein A4E58_01911 [Syntrophorhabdus sp. PtaB.Bin006]|nr:MAG: hypothetical protein A4E58_01911 [Syntrophorhabdus sp. PtaB.Bin006]